MSLQPEPGSTRQGLSYVPADTSSPLRESTVGGILREAAAEAPDRLALVEGIAGRAPAMDLRRAPVAGGGGGTRSRRALREGRAGGGVGAEHPGVGAARVRRRPRRPGAGDGEPGVPGQGARTTSCRSRGRAASSTCRASAAIRCRSRSMQVLPQLPLLRETVSFERFDRVRRHRRAASTPLPEVSPADPVQIQYTSGTTGFPKGALLHHRGITNNARLVRRATGRRARTRSTSTRCRSSTPAAACSASSVRCNERATLVNMVQFDPGLVLALAEEEQATHFTGGADHADRLHGASRLRTARPVDGRARSAPAARPCPPIWCGASSRRSASSSRSSTDRPRPRRIVTLTRPDDSPDDKANTLGPVLPQTEIKVIDPATGATVPHRRLRRALHPRLSGDARVLRDAGEDRRDDRRRRLAPHRRSGHAWTSAATPRSPAGSRT